MFTILLVLLIIVAILMIGIILLQSLRAAVCPVRRRHQCLVVR